MRSIKRIAAVLLCAVLLFCALSGCGDATPSGNDPSQNGLTPDGQLPELNIEKAYSSVPADAVIMTVDGKDVTWQEFFYFLNYYINYVKQSAGENLTDWLAEVSSGNTYFDVVMKSAIDQRIYMAAVEAAAKEAGVYNEAAAAEYADSVVAEAKASYDSEEEFNKALEDNYESLDLFRAFAENTYYQNSTYTALFGERASKLSDEDVAEQTADDNYMMAKHILLMTVYTDENGETITRNDTEKAEIRAKAQELLDQLNACPNEEFDELFDSLMKEYSEDPGSQQYFPDGYLFKEGDMVSEFYEACKALEIGEHSGIVETSYGYHIIYRIPLNYDEVPSAYSTYKAYGYDYYTLRFITSQKMMNSILNALAGKVECKMNDEFADVAFINFFI